MLIEMKSKLPVPRGVLQTMMLSDDQLTEGHLV
jgi:hypothetical protein